MKFYIEKFTEHGATLENIKKDFVRYKIRKCGIIKTKLSEFAAKYPGEMEFFTKAFTVAVEGLNFARWSYAVGFWLTD
jgi:hypothetical protein